MNYKQPGVRVQWAHGRYLIESWAGSWNLVAIRERKDAADAVCSGLLALLREHQDDVYAARARDDVDIESTRTE